MQNQFDLSSIPQDQLVAFYGLLFASAAVDGMTEREELTALFQSIDLDVLNEENKEKVISFITHPPYYKECIEKVRDGDESLKFALLFSVVEVILADDIIEPEEEEFLNSLCKDLGINEEQKQKVIEFVKTVRYAVKYGINNNKVIDALKNATSSLTAVGVPIAAVYLSGSVVGLSAAGITSGLAALGLGMGMVPGIGTAVLVGVGVYYGMRKFLGDSKRNKEKFIREYTEKKMQLTIKNLQEAIVLIVGRMQELHQKAEVAEANEEAIKMLSQRLTALQKALKIKQASLEEFTKNK